MNSIIAYFFLKLQGGRKEKNTCNLIYIQILKGGMTNGYK